MKKITEIIKEYQEVIGAGIFAFLFVAILPLGDEYTATPSSDWMFRLPILACVALLMPTLTEWVWRRTFTSLAQKRDSHQLSNPTTKKMIYYTYAATLLAIAILAHALV